MTDVATAVLVTSSSSELTMLLGRTSVDTASMSLTMDETADASKSLVGIAVISLIRDESTLVVAASVVIAEVASNSEDKTCVGSVSTPETVTEVTSSRMELMMLADKTSVGTAAISLITEETASASKLLVAMSVISLIREEMTLVAAASVGIADKASTSDESA